MPRVMGEEHEGKVMKWLGGAEVGRALDFSGKESVDEMLAICKEGCITCLLGPSSMNSSLPS